MKRNGFTLIEILVALFVFAILATITTLGLRRIINVHHLTEQKVRQLQQLQISMTLLQRDVLQMVDRPILDIDGSQLPALQAAGNGIEFTTGNQMSPANTQPPRHSNLQRVRYSIVNNNLVRTIWPVLDRASNTKALQRILMNGVTSMQIQFIDHRGNTVNSWSLGSGGASSNSNTSNTSNNTQNYPRAISIRIKIKDLGSVARVFYLPQGYTDAS